VNNRLPLVGAGLLALGTVCPTMAYGAVDSLWEYEQSVATILLVLACALALVAVVGSQSWVRRIATLVLIVLAASFSHRVFEVFAQAPYFAAGWGWIVLFAGGILARFHVSVSTVIQRGVDLRQVGKMRT